MSKKSGKSIIISVFIIIIALVLLSLTYAYYRTRIIGNDATKSLEVTSKILEITYDGGSDAIMSTESFRPGSTITKSFTVENTGTSITDSYVVYLDNVVNEFDKGAVTRGEYDDIIYTLECVSNLGNDCNDQETAVAFPKLNEVIATNYLEDGETHSYTLTINYVNLDDVNQSDDMGQELGANVQIADEATLLVIEGSVDDATQVASLKLESNPKTSRIVDGRYRLIGVEFDKSHTLTLFDKDGEALATQELSITQGETENVNGSNIIVSSGLDIEMNIGEITSSGVTLESSVKKVGHPVLGEGMTPVIYDSTTASWREVSENNSGWYDYANKKWANAMTEDGSLWVWIPRFEYKINPPTNVSEVTTSTTGKIDVNIIRRWQTTPSKGYIIHPAFENGNDNGYANGEWDTELSGFWVAKFEMSMETSIDGITWINSVPADNASGNVATTNAGNNSYVRAVSKPTVSSWRYINIANSYDNSYYYSRENESHMIKNSEWGAVVYFSHSKYGKNGAIVKPNGTNAYITGAGPAAKENVADYTYNEKHAYNTGNGMFASSNAGVTGVYDLRGGAFERVAAFNSAYVPGDINYYTDAESVSANGTNFASVGGISTKYATAYNNPTTTFYADFTVGKVSVKGDAIEELWISEDAGWFKSRNRFVDSAYPYLNRGGRYATGAVGNIFYVEHSWGSIKDHSGFRVVLVTE